MTGSVKITTKHQVQEFLSKYDVFLFDCDGVLWQGERLLPHVVETLEMLRSYGKRIVFVTNNSRKSRRQYTQKFQNFGIVVDQNAVFGSSYSAAVYLKDVVKFPADKKVLIVGESGMEEELTAAGIPWVGGTNAGLRAVEATDTSLDQLKYDPSIGCVLCGLDFHITYYKIANALVQLQNKSTLFLATNMDPTFPTNGQLLPGAGTIVTTLRYSSGREPVVLGKPSQAMMDCIKAKFHFDPSRACMVGDRLDTDIVFGIEGGLGTLLVLSGVTQSFEDSEVQPRHYIDRLGSLFEIARSEE